MSESPLKETASFIDNQLNSANYKTTLHGDAKIANFCFAEDSSKVAAVDFQYVGSGVGIKDLVYFLSSVLNEAELEKFSVELMGYYFNQLNYFIKYYDIEINFNELKKEWQSLYPYAIADFQRFLFGWMPTHYKLNGYTRKVTEELLSDLN